MEARLTTAMTLDTYPSWSYKPDDALSDGFNQPANNCCQAMRAACFRAAIIARTDAARGRQVALLRHNMHIIALSALLLMALRAGDAGTQAVLRSRACERGAATTWPQRSELQCSTVPTRGIRVQEAPACTGQTCTRSMAREQRHRPATPSGPHSSLSSYDLCRWAPYDNTPMPMRVNTYTLHLHYTPIVQASTHMSFHGAQQATLHHPCIPSLNRLPVDWW